jgi:small GTP-binding protein
MHMPHFSESTMIPEAKVVFLGESTVGKTSIVACFAEEGFEEVQAPTIGACFSLHEIPVGNDTIKLKVWDTAGQEKYRALTPMYYRDAQVAVLVFAVDMIESLTKLEQWILKLRSDTPILPELIIAGNKIDVERTISPQDGQAFADRFEATYCECSAKTEAGIQELFSLAAAKAMKARQLRGFQRRSSSSSVVPMPATEGFCC